MAEKLSVTIALEGGKQIEQQLEGIGAAGKKAFEDISQAAQQAGGFKNLKPEDVTAKLKDMGIVGEEAFNKIKDAVESASRMETIVKVVQGVEKGFAGAAAAAASFAKALPGIAGVAATIGGTLVKAMLDAADAIHKADTEAIKLGLSIEKFSELKRGFENMGLSTGAIGEGIASVNSQIEKLNLDKVAQAAKDIKEMSARGFGMQGSDQLQFLIDQAGKVGPAAKAAREALGVGEAASALQRLGVAATEASAVIPAFVEKMRQLPDSAQRTADAIAVLGPKLGTEFVQALRTGSVAIDAFKAGLGGMTQDQANAANAMDQSWNKMIAAWNNFKTAIGSAPLTSDLNTITTVLNGISTLLNATGEQWKAAIAQIFEPVTSFVERLTQAIQTSIDQVSGWINSLVSLISKVGGAISGALSGGGGGGPGAGSIPGNAAGGLIGGRGSGTSDSNLAWVSRGEHIMPARAVAQPGVLALLEALRRSGGNLRGVMNGMGRFALGGVVPQLPRFAEGGLVGGMQHLGTVDLRTDHGTARLMASSSAVEQLTRLAVTKRMTSTGRKPGFIG